MRVGSLLARASARLLTPYNTMRPVADVTVSFYNFGPIRCRRANPSNKGGEVHQLKTVIRECHRHRNKVGELDMVVKRAEDIPAT